MDIFDKLKDMGKDAAKGAQDLAATTKLNIQISDEEKKIQGIYAQLGQKYYEQFGQREDDLLAHISRSITESQARIVGYREEIQKLKGTHTCPICGAEIAKETSFCSSCGSSIAKAVDTNEPRCPQCNAVVASEAEFCTDCGTAIRSKPSEASQLLCPQCNATIMPEDVFCTSCGNKLA
jgi:predicted RNA-binding Zn-ribbon protein involved in translation (DUF1610 family)